MDSDKTDKTGLKHSQVNVIEERCKGCGFCIEFCPQKALGRSGEINSHGYYVVCMNDSDKCTGCNICDMICPEFAISVVQGKEEVRKRR